MIVGTMAAAKYTSFIFVVISACVIFVLINIRYACTYNKYERT